MLRFVGIAVCGNCSVGESRCGGVAVWGSRGVGELLCGGVKVYGVAVVRRFNRFPHFPHTSQKTNHLK